ncbi:hypothetical protein JQ616_03275 [Bradyrhizobium tropiciagri]|uniref:hypothetical protein n=1 Tax=Bradyrhizobium tropiciagri TaxID=312253 RepID=UPI001BAB974D|nr:hypothetical protein [Bradyrhizobium tropiciagri]MBR0893957.1 hypothetical protein [Bradyrhizobium tropiciagri]
MPRKPKKVATDSKTATTKTASSKAAPSKADSYETVSDKTASYWSAAYVSFCNGMTVFAVTSGVLGFLLVAKRYL